MHSTNSTYKIRNSSESSESSVNLILTESELRAWLGGATCHDTAQHRSTWTRQAAPRSKKDNAMLGRALLNRINLSMRQGAVRCCNFVICTYYVHHAAPLYIVSWYTPTSVNISEPYLGPKTSPRGSSNVWNMLSPLAGCQLWSKSPIFIGIVIKN